jgi:uncharacterized protein YneR
MDKLPHLLVVFLISVFSCASFAEDEEFQPAYQTEFTMEDEESTDKYFVRHRGRNYYTSGKENGFRVNENNEESTDETVGITTFLIAPATILYMNLVGWWE